MGSAQKGNQPPTDVQRSLFDGAEPPDSRRNNGERSLSADPNIPLHAESANPFVSARPANLQAVPIDTPAEPIWLRRLKLVIFVVFCVELGLALVVFPWTSVWIHNSLVAGHPELRTFLQHFFTRGAVSGLGVVDVWIGIWAAVQYREKK